MLKYALFYIKNVRFMNIQLVLIVFVGLRVTVSMVGPYTVMNSHFFHRRDFVVALDLFCLD